MADDVTAKGKYGLFLVPEFAKDPVGPRKDEPMSSFLRLGAFDELLDTYELPPLLDKDGNPVKDEATGEVVKDENVLESAVVARAAKLAHYAELVSSGQGGHINAEYGGEVSTLGTGVGGDRGIFLADQREDMPGKTSLADPVVMDERKEQSSKLFSRGGWWDHTDGNRISTTYGDKIEVIRGNYKMVVLHRQDDSALGGGVDLSGGHLQDLGPNSMPGASVRVEFRPDKHGGLWHLENTTNNFIQTSDYAGDFFEHWFGDKKYSTIGSDSPEPRKNLGDGQSKPYGNPHILEKTWASKIEGYTGSAKKRIPEIIEETWAEKTSSLTDVSGDITEATYCDATISSTTGSSSRRVPTIKEETWATKSESKTDVGTVDEKTTIGTSTSLTTVGAQTEVTIVGASAGVTVTGAQADVTVTGALAELSVVGGQISVGLYGLVADIKAGIGLFEARLGPAAELNFPEEKELKLKKTKAAVQQTSTVVTWQTAAVNHTTTAGNVRIGGGRVALGI